MDREEITPEARAVLHEILNTEISPELVPAGADGTFQRSEASVGPYELQDFHLYNILRYGFAPSKVAFLALHAWGDKTHGDWPPGFPVEGRSQYTLAEIKKWLRVFLHRFFATSQFKRSAMPNAQRWAPVDHFPPEATGAPPATPMRRCGSRNSSETCQGKSSTHEGAQRPCLRLRCRSSATAHP